MSKINVEYLDHMGNDKAVIHAAKISFANDDYHDVELTEKDESLIKFLARGMTTKEYSQILDMLTAGTGDRAEAVKLFSMLKHQSTHWTPFGHTTIKLRCTAPIPIRTQLFKHCVGLVANEESRRYISDTPELYLPEHIRAKPEGSIKQGSGNEHANGSAWFNRYVIHCNKAIALYEEMIADEVCPEQARFVLPQGVLVNWVWTGNLYSFANVYNKRSDPHAQVEVQDFAHQLKNIIEPLFPVSWAALTRA